MYYHNFETFAEVERKYNSTKPMVGTANKGKDIRPIGDRRHKLECVHKFSRNCYGLFHGDEGSPNRWWDFKVGLTDTEAKRLAPVLWTRHKDGSETITIRNGSGEHAHMQRYRFLAGVLPTNLSFENRNGKHFIVCRQGTDKQDYFLAKAKSKNSKNVSLTFKRNASDNVYYAKGEHSNLHYNSPRPTFTYVNGGKPKPQAPRTLVNKSVKARYQKRINSFYEWIVATGPLLSKNMGWEYTSSMKKEMRKYSREHYEDEGLGWTPTPPKLVRDALTDHEHDMRLNLAVDFLDMSDFSEANTLEDSRHVRGQYNRWINKMGGFTTTK